MEAYFLEWINLFVRWFHVIAGIAWIGASFYFVWLDNSLKNPPQSKQDKGIAGDLWAIHGGGFYEVAKYKLGPEKMPEQLHWFKWEAYTTWLTGMVLLWVVYYVGAESFLIDNRKLALSSWQATALGLGFICAGFVVYEALVKSPLRHKNGLFGLVLFGFLTFLSWLADQLFSDRGAYIHVGAVIGTIMAGNVFFGIMPAQRALVDAVQRGEAPDPRYGAFAKLRSTHNNYLTLPLIFIMISNHYPMTYAHQHGWAVLAGIIFIAGLTRHFFNLRHRGQSKPIILIASTLMLFALAGIMAHTDATLEPSGNNVISNEQAMHIVSKRCTTCHAAQPTQAGFETAGAQAGITLEDLKTVIAMKQKLLEVTQSGYMPLANMTQMTAQERQQLVDWLAAQSHQKTKTN